MYYWDWELWVQLKFSLVVSVVVRRMYYWDCINLENRVSNDLVSVVVRRMYYWDLSLSFNVIPAESFSSC